MREERELVLRGGGGSKEKTRDIAGLFLMLHFNPFNSLNNVVFILEVLLSMFSI